MLATSAMLVRNAVLLFLPAPVLMASAALPLALMLIGSSVPVFRKGKKLAAQESESPLELGSPFSLASALMNLPLLARAGDRVFMRRVGLRTLLVLVLGVFGLWIQPGLFRLLAAAVKP
jgi:hypothetical protein